MLIKLQEGVGGVLIAAALSTLPNEGRVAEPVLPLEQIMLISC